MFWEKNEKREKIILIKLFYLKLNNSY